MSKKSIESFLVKLMIVLLVLPQGLLLQPAEARAEEQDDNVVYQNDFSSDNGDLIASGGAEHNYVSDKHFEGNDNGYALEITNRSASYDGADLSFDIAGIEIGKEYVITVNGFVDEDVDVPEGYQMVVQNLPYGNPVDLFLGSHMTAGESMTSTGNFNTSELDVADDNSLRIQTYFGGEGDVVEVPFYIGEIKIEEVDGSGEDSDEEDHDYPEDEEEPGEEESGEEEDEVPFEPITIGSFDFEENADGFTGNGDATVSRSTDESHTGDYSLFVTDRSADWHGARVELTDSIYPTATYRVTGFVKSKDFTEDEEFKATVDDGDYTTFAQVNITSDEWTEFTGEYQTKIGAEDLQVYFESSDVTSEYYLDDITFEMIAPAEDLDDSEPAPEFETIDFEDTDLHETFNGFEARGGEEELSIVEGVNHTEDGNYSLLTENRTQEWHGVMIDVFEYIDLGSEYEVSVWVKMDEPASANVQLKAQIGSGDGASYPDIASATVTDGEWVHLEGTYTFNSSGGGNLAVYLETDNPNESFYIDDFSLVKLDTAPTEIQHDLPSLKEIYEDDFLIGNAVNLPDFEGVRSELLDKHFNLVTAENAMKPAYVHDADGNLDFETQNEFVQTAIDAGFKVHGHAITWHSQSNYDILFPEGIEREEAIESLESYIEAAIENYAQFGNDIVSWDILNEAIVVRGEPYDDWTAHLRDTRALEVIGDDYIQIIFEKAKEVRDREGLDFTLYYNDYNDHLQDKAQIMYYMVKDINETYQAENNTDELLIEAVGMQSHYNNNLNPANVRQSMERFISLGVEIGVTELDVMAGDDYVLTEDEANRQGYVYASIFEIYKEHSEHISRVTFWGLDDGSSWRGEQNPLLFDNRLQAKPAFHAVADPTEFLDGYEEVDLPPRRGQAIYADEAPTIDGEIDSVWDEAVVMNSNRAQQAWQTARADTRALWDDDFLYVLLEVSASELDDSNANAWEQDSVEVFLDQANTKQASYASNEGFGQYRVNFNNVFTTGSGGPYDGVETATTVDGTNYVVEMKIPLYAIEPVDGHVLGFDFQVNDMYDEGGSRGVMAWNDTTGQGFSDPSLFGELILVSDREETISETEVILGESVTLVDATKLIINELKGSITVPADIPFGTEVLIEKYSPDNETNVSGEVLTPAGEMITVTFNFPEGEEDYEGEFELELGISDDAINPAIYYLGADGWEHRGGMVEEDVISLKVSGFSTYGVFEAEVEDAIDDISDLIEELEERIRELEESGVDTSELEETVRELIEAVEALEASDEAQQAMIDDLLARVQSLEESVTEQEEEVAEEADETDEETEASEDESEDDEVTTTDEDEYLPDTATFTFNWLMIGLLFILAGGLTLFVIHRRQTIK
ncbi:endo-1,4-beta-xylanase [Pelagirhabdus alkalitolerans]|uniref:endo-1,4-beta-xylanase n=1 Tax=Pelagirhabdus alkalitolerans TaxID=1612202 RepID=A0A1G6KIC6_9BACI|nr:endo-1,4-beta-xylanase [Pelagirhabdus alkalitolerans]SDC30315.1 endo-1,4-beta-xylanase [Pelagirhabdus alkalitolerans]